MKIQIKKFKRHENVSFEIPAEIAGGNELGKTTILEAISFCLTGKNLDGKEFEQIYDNRVDLHDAIADVSYFDNYGNEYRRIVSPIFQTSRAGIEEVKIKRNTVCKKNDIAVNDFASEFASFYKFGTDFFFNQKEDIQRAIFIDSLKSKMPDYDIVNNALKLKELQKGQKTAVSEIEGLRDLQKHTKDVDVPLISDEIKKLNGEYIAMTSSDNSVLVSEINRKNNAAMSKFYQEKNEISDKILKAKAKVGAATTNLAAKMVSLDDVTQSVFTKSEKKSTTELEKQASILLDELSDKNFYETIEDYAAANFEKNPVLVENQKKIIWIQTLKLSESELGSVTSACPLSGEACKTAKLYKDSSEQLIFKNKNEAEIQKIRSENRSILISEMDIDNYDYQNIKRQFDNLEKVHAEISAYNLKIESENETAETKFKSEKFKKINILDSEIAALDVESAKLKKEIELLEKQLSELVQPKPESLPEFAEIPQNLIDAHEQFESENETLIGNVAINKNNAKKRVEYETQIIEKQSLLFELDKMVVKIKNEISDYFSNLTNIVKTEFSGSIDIGVELLEFVMSRDEYKDCFRIVANGKAFPFECNGALQNNVKLQVLSALQRLNNYTGVTLMDNCESNTTTPINHLKLNCVLAYATNDKELTIRNI